ncbi:MAG: iron(III) ABC transporter [Gammaproteobacteria bacterium]|nr:iron(III) ABC transporter [Gammaproteobacteria bacterium]
MRWVVLMMCGLLAACQVTPVQKGATEPVELTAQQALPKWQSPRARDHQRVGQIMDMRSRQVISVAQLVQELATTPVLLLGEKHDNPDHHALQLWLLDALAAQRQQGAVVMEMLTVDQQAKVDAVQADVRQGTVPADIPAALNWHKGWDWQQYGEFVSHVLAQPYPLLAGNLNRDALMQIYRQPPVLKGVESTRADVTQRLSAQIRESHCNKLPEAQLPAMLAVQQQRDRTMAQVVLDAPKPALLIAGAYHTRYDFGVPLHLHDLQAAAGTTPPVQQRVLIFAEADQEIDAGAADFIWYTPAVAEKDYCADL